MRAAAWTICSTTCSAAFSTAAGRRADSMTALAAVRSGKRVLTSGRRRKSLLTRRLSAVIRSSRSRTRTGAACRTLQVHIPAGIDSGKSIRLKGKGMPGTGGGEPGDLLLKVRVGGKPGFERKGMDVYSTAEIPFTTAVFGGEGPRAHPSTATSCAGSGKAPSRGRRSVCEHAI